MGVLYNSVSVKLLQNQKLKDSLLIFRGFEKTDQNGRNEGTLETSKQKAPSLYVVVQS